VVRRSGWRAAAVGAAAALLVGVVPASAGPEPVRSGAVSAYFFGDSLMAGTGTSPRRPVMARVAAARLGWAVEVDAWGGTGYTTGGRSPSYLQRLQHPGALRGRYDVVLLEGGYNDWRVGSDPREVAGAAREVVTLVRARQPAAQVVLMGAYDPPGQSDPHRDAVDAALRQLAADEGLPFFSPLSGRWAADQEPGRFLHADGVHPTEHGYGVMGARLAGALRELDAAVDPDGLEPPTDAL
jgi:lysophospholipase L1-like esterase